jgi:PEP-CTERM motif
MKRALASIAVVLFALAGASASTISDNFESYALGTFPSPTWLDVGTVEPSLGTPIPSATVVATTDAFGHPTQALATANALANSRGIYATVPISNYYTLAADIRVDQYSDHPTDTTVDWAMQLTFANAGVINFCCTPQAGIYASSLTEGWRLFVIGGPGADIDLGVPANIGTWYKVQLTFDVSTATFHSVIVNDATGMVLVNRFDTVLGLNASNTQYNSIAFFGGEGSAADTLPNLAVVDNVNISATTPEPSTLLLIGSGLSLLATRLRKR